jgi:hypothetical protein
LMIGSLLSWVPFAGAVGGLVGLIGAIFIIIGRDAFGPDHARNVIVAIIVFVVGIGVFAVGFILVLFAAISGAISNPGSVSTQPTGYAVVLLIASAIFGIAEVLFTYALQNGTGRLLLWSAYIIALAMGLVSAFVLPLAPSNMSFLFSSGIFLLSALLAAPAAVVYGIAFYVARERIERREIPAPIPQQGPTPGGPIN